jgi:gluconokinase
MNKTIILALDLGTSSVRAMLFDARGEPLPGAEAQIPYDQRTTADGGVDVDPEMLFGLTIKCVRQLIRKTERAVLARIAGVGVSCFWHSLMGVDGDGRAVTPLYSWADTRSSAHAERLREEIAPEEAHQRTGAFLHPSFWPAKLRWLQEAEPALYGRARRWMSFGEYVALRLFGGAACSVSMASGTGLLNVASAEWDSRMLETLGITPKQLNPHAEKDQAQCGLLPEFARTLAPLKDLPWFPAIGDGACSNVGSGAADERRLAMNVGTSGAMRVVVRAEKATVLPGLYCYRVDSARCVLGGGFTCGGNVHAWLRETLKLNADEAAVSPALGKMPPDGHGLTMLPFWAGERAPGWHTDARAAIIGMNLHTSPLDIARAALEAVALSYDSTRAALQSHYPKAEEIVASGGAIVRDPVWARIMADVFGVPVTVSRVGEASSRGAALLALESLGFLNDASEAPLYLGRRYLPDPHAHEVYRQALKRYDSLYGSLLKDVR